MVNFTEEEVAMYTEFFKKCDGDNNGFIDKG